MFNVTKTDLIASNGLWATSNFKIYRVVHVPFECQTLALAECSDGSSQYVTTTSVQSYILSNSHLNITNSSKKLSEFQYICLHRVYKRTYSYLWTARKWNFKLIIWRRSHQWSGEDRNESTTAQLLHTIFKIWPIIQNLFRYVCSPNLFLSLSLTRTHARARSLQFRKKNLQKWLPVKFKFFYQASQFG